MDYEQKYKEALERAKEIIECSKSDTKEVRMVLSFFPELKENEDEKTIKEIKQFIHSRGMSLAQSKVDSWIAWLEKQGEQKPVISYDALREGIGHFGITQYQIDYWLKKYVVVEKQCEQKQELLTKEKALKNSPFVEQKPTEWSEEDEDVINHLLAICAGAKRYRQFAGCLQEDITKYQTWLKSLKGRYTWKPSDYELEVLKLAAEKDGTCLMGLYEQLKKL